MSLGDINTTGRNRNVLSPVVEPTIVTAPTSPITPPFDATTSSFTLKATNFNLLGPIVSSPSATSVLFTGTDGGAFSVPAGKNVIVKNLYIRLTGVARTGTYLGYNWTAPQVRCYKSGTTTFVSNTFSFSQGVAPNPPAAAIPVAEYNIDMHFGFNSTPAGGRRTLLAGESMILGILAIYAAGTSGFTYTTLRGDGYAECLLVNV